MCTGEGVTFETLVVQVETKFTYSVNMERALFLQVIVLSPYPHEPTEIQFLEEKSLILFFMTEIISTNCCGLCAI